jgi:integrase
VLDLDAWFEQVYRPLKRKLKKQATFDDYATLRLHFKHYLIERDAKQGIVRTNAYPADLSDINIGGYMAWKEAAHKVGKKEFPACQPPTINKHRRYLMAMAAIAKKKGFIAELPDVERCAEFDREPECWSIEEMGAILDAASTETGMIGESPARLWWQAIIWMVFNTGFRISALMSVKSCDVQLDKRWLIVRAEQQKDKADQPMDLLPETIAALHALNFKHLACVFDDWPYDRGQRQWKTLNKYLKRILERAGLSAGRKDLWHKYRRTFATYITANSDLETARSLCGHSNSKTTKRYIDPRKLKTPLVANLLPRPQVARQLKLFQSEEAS